MRIVGPQAFTVGQPTQIKDPAQGGGNPSIACQIQNSSSYQLLVNAGGAQLSIQPFWAQTIEISGQPITIQPVAGTGSGSTASPITLAFLLGTAAGTGEQLPDGTWIEAPPQDDGSLTAAAITASVAPPGTLFGPTVLAVVANAVTQSVPISSTTRTVIVDVTTGAPGGLILGIKVQGNQSGFIYRTGPYYLQAPSTNGYIAVVPVSGVLDTSVTVSLTNVPAGTVNLSVFGDSTETPESVFYNGSLLTLSQSLLAAGAITVATGPFRLLSAEVFSAGGSSAFLSVGGPTLLVTESPTAGGQGTSAAIGLPSNTIVPAGAAVVLTQQNAGFSEATLATAYP